MRTLSAGENAIIGPAVEDEQLADSLAREIVNLISHPERMRSVIEGVRKLKREVLWTWDERLGVELSAIREVAWRR